MLQRKCSLRCNNKVASKLIRNGLKRYGGKVVGEYQGRFREKQSKAD